MANKLDLIRSSAQAVRLASYANWGFAAAVVAGLVASATLGARFTAMLLGGDAGTIGIRCMLLLGIALALAIFLMLRALDRIISTVSTGDPFVLENAARLRTIGWSLLGIQLLDLPAALIAHGFPALGSAASDWSISPAGWLAALMAFVLARVFTVGAAMRDDLAGTV